LPPIALRNLCLPLRLPSLLQNEAIYKGNFQEKVPSQGFPAASAHTTVKAPISSHLVTSIHGIHLVVIDSSNRWDRNLFNRVVTKKTLYWSCLHLVCCWFLPDAVKPFIALKHSRQK
jgi:hypothetical protein